MRTSALVYAEHEKGGTNYSDHMMTEREVAEFLRVSVRCVQNWRTRGGGPRYVPISRRCIRYPKAEVIAWLDARTRAHTSAADPHPVDHSNAELTDRSPDAGPGASEADAEPTPAPQLPPAAAAKPAEGKPRPAPPAARPRRLRTLLPHDRD